VSSRSTGLFAHSAANTITPAKTTATHVNGDPNPSSSPAPTNATHSPGVFGSAAATTLSTLGTRSVQSEVVGGIKSVELTGRQDHHRRGSSCAHHDRRRGHEHQHDPHQPTVPGGA
jgi:hypothetical protein